MTIGQMKNTCGICTMCCKLLGVQELQKPTNKWCEHCVIGVGCSIYEERPHSCVDFECGYLMSNLPKEYRPDNSHMIITGESNGSVIVHVDPAHPNAHETSIGKQILNIIHKSKRSVILVIGDKRKFLSTSFKDLERVQKMMLDLEKKGE